MNLTEARNVASSGCSHAASFCHAPKGRSCPGVMPELAFSISTMYRRPSSFHSLHAEHCGTSNLFARAMQVCKSETTCIT